MAINSTFEHEPWNPTPSSRVIPIVDCWHPDLTEIERCVLAEILPSLDDHLRALVARRLGV